MARVESFRQFGPGPGALTDAGDDGPRVPEREQATVLVDPFRGRLEGCSASEEQQFLSQGSANWLSGRGRHVSAREE